MSKRVDTLLSSAEVRHSEGIEFQVRRGSGFNRMPASLPHVKLTTIMSEARHALHAAGRAAPGILLALIIKSMASVGRESCSNG